MSKAEASGLCQLTRKHGPFAKSHIIPDAFMRRLTDAPFMEWDGYGRPIKRFTGWYDSSILSQEGEALIARYDDAATKTFLNAGWTYRRRRHPDLPEVLVDNFSANQLYTIDNVDTDLVKLFGLSLLWRAAVSSLETFNSIRLKEDFLEDLRLRILAGEAGKPLDIPVYFSLFDGSEELTRVAPTAINNHPFYRFFLDGVVCYVGRGRANMFSRRVPTLMVGAEPGKLSAICIPSQGSAQSAYTTEAMNELRANHGDVFRGEYQRPYRKL